MLSVSSKPYFMARATAKYSSNIVILNKLIEA